MFILHCTRYTVSYPDSRCVIFTLIHDYQQKQKEKNDGLLDELRREIGLATQMERKEEKEDVIFKTKREKANQTVCQIYKYFP